MKKILILALVVLLASCSEEQMKKWDEKQYSPTSDCYYKGHHYIIWEASRFLNGVVHDPDCPCHLDTLDIWVEKNDTTYRIKKKER